MNYLSFAFLFFIVVFVFFYYCVKQAYRYVILFFGSYFFYGYANPKMLIVLILVTLVSYFGGLIISKKRSKAAYVLFFALEVILLALFKYRVFLLTNISSAVELITGRSLWGGMWNIALPIGLSFMVFQACTYLSDVYRGRISVEKNIIKYATFVSFFPTVLSGPIQKSRYLLPQISAPKGFDYDQSKKGTLLFVWGAFEKIVVSNKLCQTYTGIYSNFGERASAELLIGAICFSLFIYSDFSAYSDMARGISKILGIDVGKNFINPYLSQNMSEFWNRWHVSLNEWFVENIYIPLGGSRKGKLRKIVNIMVVFAISGLWHGAYWHFVAWGVINGAFVVIGLLIKPIKTNIYAKLNIDEKGYGIVLIRRLTVFYLISLTWIFFSSGIWDSLRIIKKIVFFNYLSFFDPNILNISGNAVATFVTVIATLIFCKVQIERQDEKKMYVLYNSQPFFLQCLLVSCIISICIFTITSTNANIDTQFLYFKF